MNKDEREAAKERFNRFLCSPSMQKTLDTTISNDDAKKYNPIKMPSSKRLEAISKIYLGAIR